MCLEIRRVILRSGKILEHFNISNFFTVVGGAKMDGSRNSKIAVLEHVLENISEKDKSKILMVGDKHHDLEGAAHVGVDCFGVLYGYGDFDELNSYLHVEICQKASDVLSFILNSSFIVGFIPPLFLF